MPQFDHDADQRTVQDVVNLHKAGQLNLSPGFQRNSVWNERDRAKLIDSIIRNYPLPAIFLYRRRDDGNIVYDVIDGKQRLESILMFMGIIRGNRFEARLRLPPYRDYLLTVLQGTDDLEQRKKRETIIRGVLQSLFETKDERRIFTAEQRRVLWNSSASRKCQTCNKQLSWTDFTIDHIDPYSKGGRTRLKNAALMCKKHNSAKGNRKAG